MPNDITTGESRLSVEPDEVWHERDVARFFGYSRRTIRRWRRAGFLPFLQLPGGRMAYRAASIRKVVEEWERW